MLLVLGFQGMPAALASHPVDYNACRDALDWLAWREQREFRATLFGLKRARDAGISEVRFATDKSIWVKTNIGTGVGSSATVDEWESVAKGYNATTWYDGLIDSMGDVKPRTGIFEARRRLSSELIPHITQAYRTFECRLDDLCRLLELSDTVSEHDPQNITINTVGCNEVRTKTLSACHLPTQNNPLTTQGNLLQYCQTMTQSMRIRETQVLKLVAEYDAGYRSILQLSGIFRAFLSEMRATILGSLRSGANLIATFSRIPCFLGSCDDAPPSAYPAP